MKRIHKILLTVLCLALVVSAVVVVPLSASAASVPSSPYSEYNAPAGYYYFTNDVSNFSDISDFEYTVESGFIYYGPYRILKISKVNNSLVCNLLDVDDVTVLENRVIYNGDNGDWYLLRGLSRAVFYVADSLNVNHQFARMLLYRSSSQSLIVKGRYKLLDSIYFDTSVWQYKMTGEFFVNGVLYDTMTFTKDTKYIYAINSNNNVSMYLRSNGVNNGDYTIDIPFAYVTLSVYNNFYNIFSRISQDSHYDFDYLYYSLNNTLPLPSFLVPDGYGVSKTFNVSGYFPIEATGYSVMEFSSLTFSIDANEHFTITYNERGLGYSSLYGYGSDSFYLLKINATTADAELISYLELASSEVGGQAAYSYYERVGFYSGLEENATVYKQGYNAGYSDGNTAGYNEGYSAGETAGYGIGYNAGYSVGKTDGYNQALLDTEGCQFYTFDSLSDSFLNEIGLEGFFTKLYLISRDLSNSNNPPLILYDYLMYKDGQLLAVEPGQDMGRVIYENGKFTDNRYSYWCLAPGNPVSLIELCSANATEKKEAALESFSEILSSTSFSTGYNLGFEQGAEGIDIFDLASWLDSSVGGFMGLEIFPGFSIGGIMSVVVGVALLSFFLKLFMGG